MGRTALTNSRESWIVGRLKQAIRAAVQDKRVVASAKMRESLCILSVCFLVECVLCKNRVNRALEISEKSPYIKFYLINPIISPKKILTLYSLNVPVNVVWECFGEEEENRFAAGPNS